VTDAPARLLDRALALRRDFDGDFARPPSSAAAALVDLLAIRVAGDPYALRLDEVAGLAADRRVTPVPSPAPELLGLVGFRGGVHPVYSLRALLGYPAGALPRWLVFLGAGALVGVAVDGYDGHLRVARAELAARPSEARQHVGAIAEVAGGALPVLSVASLRQAITRRIPGDRPRKE
jgi:purine-binding chemotaxis protein CheW